MLAITGACVGAGRSSRARQADGAFWQRIHSGIRFEQAHGNHDHH